ncbi:MAG: leucine-rich repeat protein [Prevotella sp.]|nr:leucine-rich repeat protein [Prevotella sp.]
MRKKIYGLMLCLMGLVSSSECFAAPSWYDYKEPITKGTGTMEDPYLIESAEQLAWLAYDVNVTNNSYENKVVALGADINLNKTVDGERVSWNPIGTSESCCFKGLFLGLDLKDFAANGFKAEQKHKITGMYIEPSSTPPFNNFGLFGYLAGNVSHLQLEDITINMDVSASPFNSNMYVGGLCGRTMDANNQPSDYNGDDVWYRGEFKEGSGTQTHYVTFAIEDVSVSGNITVKSNLHTIAVGGICGRFDNMGILHSTFNGNIATTNCEYVGGICGIACGKYNKDYYADGKCLYDCATNATITCNDNFEQDISNITRPIMVGGIVGQINYKNSAYACVSTGSIRCKYTDSIYPLYNAGGLCGNMQSATILRACGSTMLVKAFGNVGGIVGKISGSTDTGQSAYTKVECCTFSGHLDGSMRLTNEKGETTGGTGTNPYHNYVGGICGNLEWDDDKEHITRCLLLGTITTDEFIYHDIKPSAIVGKAGENIASTVTYCYYDTNLYCGNAIPGSKDGRQSVKGLTTEELTSANTSKVTWLNADDSETTEYGYRLEKGLYPIFYENNGKSATYYNDYTHRLFENNNLAKLFDFYYSNSPVNMHSTVYASGAILCSMPVNFVKGDCAGDFVSTMSAPTKTYNYTEKDTGREVTLTCENLFPETSVITVKDKTASAYDKGTCFVTTTGVVRKKSTILNRPAFITGTKYIGLNSTIGQPWNGEEADGYAAGTGTAGDPYLIKNASQLLHAIKNNSEGEFYKQMCDIRINIDYGTYGDGTSLLTKANLGGVAPDVHGQYWQTNECSWQANYNGNGHSVSGLYIEDYVDTESENLQKQHFSLFGSVYPDGSISNLAVIDTWIDVSSYSSSKYGIIAGHMAGTISNCITQGISATGNPCGGICGKVTGKVEDCVSAVFPYTTTLDNFSPFVVENSSYNDNIVKNCLYVTPVTYSSADKGTDKTYLHNCYWLKGYEPNNSGYTLDEIGNALGSLSRWTWKEGYFPTLKTFADTEIGKLMTLPVRTDKGFEYDANTKTANNYLLGFTKMLEFEPGSTEWSNIYGTDFIEADGELGIVVPTHTMTNESYFVIPSETEAIWTKMGKTNYFIPMRTSAVSVENGITFIDSKAEEACVAAFDTNHDNRLSLSELKNVTNEQTLSAFQNATGQQIVQFPEFRFFKSVTNLTTQLSGLSNLKEVRLPYNLTTIGGNDGGNYIAPFQGCSQLTDITIPGKVTTVSPGAFYGSSVENILVDPFNTKLVSRDGILFDKNNVLISYPNGRSGEEAVVAGVVDGIAEGAIYKVDGLRNLYFDTTDYTTVVDLKEDGIVSDNGDLIDVYVSDATYGSVLYNDYLDDDAWSDYVDADKLHYYYPLKIGSAKAGTLYIGFDTELPAGLRSYIVESDSYPEEAKAYLKKTSNQIPSRSPIVVFADAPGTYRLFPLEEQLEPWKMFTNLLNGVGRDGMEVYQSDADRGSILTLGRNSGGTLGFFYYKGTDPIKPYRAYLTYEWLNPSKPFVLFSFLDENITGIGNVNANDNVNDDAIYDLNGRKVADNHALPKGIYIRNGKKIVVK